MRKGFLAAMAATVALPLALAACGDDSDGGAGGSDSKSPIKVATIGSFESPVYSVPWVEVAAKAAVKRINAAGGIDGRQLKLFTCNDKFDPNEATACAQRAVQDGVVAVVGPLSPNIGAMAQIFKAAHIPIIGPGGADGKSETTSDISYPINASPVGFAAGGGALAVKHGGPNVVIVQGDNQTARDGADWAELGVKAAHGTSTRVTVPLGGADYSASAASVIAKHPGGVNLQGAGADMGRVAIALRQAGYTGAITGASSVVTPGVLQALGAKENNIYLASRGKAAGDTSIPEIAEFHKAMVAEDPKVNIDDIGLNTWLSYKVFEAAVTGHKISDGASVISAMDSIDKPIELGGAYPDYPGIPANPRFKEYPRVATWQVGSSRVEGGKIVGDKDFFDPFAD